VSTDEKTLYARIVYYVEIGKAEPGDGKRVPCYWDAAQRLLAALDSRLPKGHRVQVWTEDIPDQVAELPEVR
jgi:hypothetical protein